MEQTERGEEPHLERALGLVECTLMGVGVILGAGIYVLIGRAAGLAANAVWISFLTAAVVAGLTGLSYAELSSFIPKAGGEYYYVRRAFGESVAFLVTWLLSVGVVICASAVALGFAGYFTALFRTNPIWTASALVTAAAMLLAYGIKQSAWVAGLCTVLELAGLAIVIAIGVPRLGTVDYLETTTAGSIGVLSAATLVFFAYIGFEEIVQLSEETRESTKTIPRAVLLSVVISTVLYVIVAICAVSVLDWERLGTSDSPLADVAAVGLGPNAFVLLSTIALFSTGNTVLILVMSAARLLYGMAEDGALPSRLAKIHRTRKTPHVATLVVAVAAIMVIVGLERIEVVANLTNFVMLVTFAIVNAAAIVLRYREPDAPRPFKVPLAVGRMPVIPLLGAATSVFMLSYVGATAMIAGVLVTLSGVVFAFLFRGKRTGGVSPSG